jgi:hypothetical protein
MHAPLDSLSSTFTNSTRKGQAWWAASINFVGISWWHVKQVELGSMDMTQNMKHQVEGPIRSGRERLGGATRGARGQESCRGEMIVLEERRDGEEHRGRPHLHKEPPRLPFSAGKLPSPSFVCVFKFVCSKPP